MNFRSCKKSHYFKTWPSSKTIVGVLDLAQFVSSFPDTSGTALLRKCLSVLFSDAETFQTQKKVLRYIQYILMVKMTHRKEKDERSGLTLCSWSVHIGHLQNTRMCVQNTSERKILQSDFQDWWTRMSGEGFDKMKLKFVSSQHLPLLLLDQSFQIVVRYINIRIFMRKIAQVLVGHKISRFQPKRKIFLPFYSEKCKYFLEWK